MSALVITPDEGRTFLSGPFGALSKLMPEHTGGAFAIVEHPIAPGVLVPPHLHQDEDEFSYVLEGTVGVRVGDETPEAGPGCYVIKPRGTIHTFWNAGPAPARLIEIISPAGFERYFEELGQLFAQNPSPDPERIEQLAAKYRLTFYYDWVPELTARYNLSLRGRS